MTTVPWPGVLATDKSPPCSSATRLTMASPEPLPPSSVAALVEAVERVRQVVVRDAGALFAHGDAGGGRRAFQPLCVQGEGADRRAEFQRVVHQVGPRALNQLHIDSDHDGNRVGAGFGALHRHAELLRALGEAHRQVVEQLVQRAKSPRLCTSRRATPTSLRSASCAMSPAQRFSNVFRQAVVAVSGERRSCDKLPTPSRRK